MDIRLHMNTPHHQFSYYVYMYTVAYLSHYLFTVVKRNRGGSFFSLYKTILPFGRILSWMRTRLELFSLGWPYLWDEDGNRGSTARDQHLKISFTVPRPMVNPVPTRNQTPKTTWLVLPPPPPRPIVTFYNQQTSTEGRFFLRYRRPTQDPHRVFFPCSPQYLPVYTWCPSIHIYPPPHPSPWLAGCQPAGLYWPSARNDISQLLVPLTRPAMMAAAIRGSDPGGPADPSTQGSSVCQLFCISLCKLASIYCIISETHCK